MARNDAAGSTQMQSANETIATMLAAAAFRHAQKIKGGGPFFGPAALIGRSED
jgi:hypothetical protein